MRGSGGASAGCSATPTKPDMRWLLRLLLNDADRRAIENDLAELYELRTRGCDGDAAAAQLAPPAADLLYPFHLLAERLRSAPSSGSLTMVHILA